MTIKVHHLNESRSQRILWMLEELALKYEIVPYQRDPVTRLAPPELKNIHPLGKSPVIEDVVDGNSRVVAESGAILDYLARWHGGGKFSFAPDDPQWPDYLHWMHYAEGSAMLPLMLNLYTARLGDAAAPLMPRITSEIDNHLGYVNGAIAGKEFIVGDKFTITLASLTRADYSLGDDPHADPIRPDSPLKVPLFAANIIASSKIAKHWTIPSAVKGLVLLSGPADTYVDGDKTRAILSENAPHFEVAAYPTALHEIDNEVPSVRAAMTAEILRFLGGL